MRPVPAASVPGSCERCGFDPAEWDPQDVTATLRQAAHLAELGRAALPDSVRPFVDAAPEPLPAVTGAGPAADLEQAHRLVHHLRTVADQRAAAGDLPPVQHGTVTQLSRSDGGVPKLAVGEAQIVRRGLAGDRQRSRVHHGRVWQALCLWSAEVIEALQAEGHPIAAGNAGENITIRGLDWRAVRAGLELHIGPARCRVTAPAQPCRKNSRWFADADPSRIDHALHPGWSRWYAQVEAGAAVRVGDAVVLAPR